MKHKVWVMKYEPMLVEIEADSLDDAKEMIDWGEWDLDDIIHYEDPSYGIDEARQEFEEAKQEAEQQ